MRKIKFSLRPLRLFWAENGKKMYWAFFGGWGSPSSLVCDLLIISRHFCVYWSNQSSDYQQNKSLNLHLGPSLDLGMELEGSQFNCKGMADSQKRAKISLDHTFYCSCGHQSRYPQVSSESENKVWTAEDRVNSVTVCLFKAISIVFFEQVNNR